MLIKAVIAFFGLILGYWILASESSLMPLFYEVCEKGKETGAEQCAPYNFVSYALHKLIVFVDAGNTIISAISTAAIAVFTYTLYKATKGLVEAAQIQSTDMKRSIAASEIAANAADLSARAAIALQLPIIRVQPSGLGRGESINGQGTIEDCYVHSVIVSNLGDTKAFPKEVLFGWTAGETLPDKPKYKFVMKFPQNCILQPNQLGLSQSLHGSLILKEGQWAKICGGNYLWFYCAILYEDFMGETRSHGFCWLWGHDGTGMGWRIEKAAAYNKKNAALSEPPQYP
jgi:amino acid transporter